MRCSKGSVLKFSQCSGGGLADGRAAGTEQCQQHCRPYKVHPPPFVWQESCSLWLTGKKGLVDTLRWESQVSAATRLSLLREAIRKHSKNRKTLPFEHLMGCQCVKVVFTKKFHYYYRQVLLQFKFLSFVTIWVFLFLFIILVIEFVTILFSEFFSSFHKLS